VLSTQSSRIEQDIPADWREFEVRKAVQQQLVLIGNILAPKLQGPNREFEREFRYLGRVF